MARSARASGGGDRASCGPIVRAAAAALAVAQLLVGCTLPSRHDTTAEREQTRAVLDRHVPRSVEDRSGWIEDMEAVFSALRIEASSSNVCAVLAVAEQESGYRTDPVVPDLPAITMREIDRRADGAHVPKVLVHGVLALPSSTGESYRARLDRVRTERELSAIFDDFVDRVPLGRRLFGELNPVHTRGTPMPHAALPRIRIEGPKISRALTNEWFAKRVDERYRRCLDR